MNWFHLMIEFLCFFYLLWKIYID